MENDCLRKKRISGLRKAGKELKSLANEIPEILKPSEKEEIENAKELLL